MAFKRALGMLVVVVAMLVPALARADYAPVDQPGPPLSVAPAQLAAALACNGSLGGSGRPPILLVPGTTLNPDADFAWNWERALRALRWPYCTVALPGNAMGDIQIAGEFVVNAIRTMHARAGGRIDIVGHSQGGMVPRWALRFWPDTRAMVDDLVGLSPSNHGTLDATVVCALSCAPAIWQQRNTAAFIAALNSRQETFPGVSYTNVYTYTDEVVVPNFGPAASSALSGRGGQITNVAIQQVCPLDTTEHIGVGTYDNTAYRIAIDALSQPGPADPAHVSADACWQPLMPGVDPLTFALDLSSTLATVSTTLATYPHTPAEPALACYVTASCPAAPPR